VDDIGLENHAESRELLKFDPKVTPNPTLSDSERHLLYLFLQLPEREQQKLIEVLDADQRDKLDRPIRDRRV